MARNLPADRERRVDAALWLAVALAAGAPLALAPWATSLAALVGTWMVRDRLSLRLRVAALLILAASGWRAREELQQAGFDRQLAQVVLSPPRRCEIELAVVRSPVVVRSGQRQAAGRARLDGTVLDGRCELDGGDGPNHVLPPGLRARLYGAPEDLARGDRLHLVADLAVTRAWRNPGLPDPRIQAALSGVVASGGVVVVVQIERAASVAARVDRVRSSVRRRIEDTFPGELAPFARALVLGETDLADDDREAFRRSGLAHLLAVSGTHLILAVLALAQMLRSILVRIEGIARRFDVGRLVAATTIPAAWLYADFAGGGGSAYRAAAMLTVAMVARAAGRRPSATRCFALSLAAGALVEPLAICDLSFALSVGATAGLIVVQRPLAGLAAQEQRPLRGLLLALGATAAAVAGCAPVLLSIGPQLPLLGVAANVLAAPVGELAALPLCLLHAAAGWAPAAQQGLALLASGALQVVRAIAHAASDSPLATIELPPPTSWQLACLACGALACWLTSRGRRIHRAAVTLALVTLLELAAMWRGHPRGELRVTVLDVGQGDALLVDLPDGRLMVVDGGGLVGSPIDVADRVILPVLRERRRRRIDVMVLTHPHPDHYGGLATLLARIPAQELWLSGVELDGPASGALGETVRAARQHGARLRTAAELCHESARFGAARVEVLAPCPRFVRGRPANDNSLVLRLALGKRAALLVGDAERTEEEELLRASPERLAADFLKVGHHGSRTSTTAQLIEAVSPSVAAISCGARNRFGHPASSTLRRLSARGARTLRTDRVGAIVWSTDGELVSVTQRFSLGRP